MSTTSNERCAVGSFEEANRAIYQIKDCQSEAEVEALLRPLIRFFGTEWYVFVCLRRNDPGAESYRYFIGCMPEWCQMYNARKWYAIDPFAQYALQNSSPVLGSAIKPESAGQRELLAAASQHGFRSGIVVPAHTGLKSRIGVLYLGSSKPPEETEQRLWENRNLLRAVGLELLEWWISRLRAEALSGLEFDDLDVELLSLAHKGYTTLDAAKELGITSSRINSRFRRINMKLNVAGRKQATLKAIDIGLLRI